MMSVQPSSTSVQVQCACDAQCRWCNFLLCMLMISVCVAGICLSEVGHSYAVHLLSGSWLKRVHKQYSCLQV